MGVSGCTYVRDAFAGAFCLFESIASMLPFVDEVCVFDFGSEDKTRDVLFDIAASNPHIRVDSGSVKDASPLTDAAHRSISMAKYDHVVLWQADEIWHEQLLLRMVHEFLKGNHDLAFWRVQLRDNFQKLKWWPHRVHRAGPRDNMTFVGDAMNTDRAFNVPVCSEHDGVDWTWWDGKDPLDIDAALHGMILDVSLVGGFRDNIVKRGELNGALRHEGPNIEGTDPQVWYMESLLNPDWTKETTPFNIPTILKYHVGKVKYELRPELLDALKKNDTKSLLGL